jgi:AcrR family transcriptional regulator
MIPHVSPRPRSDRRAAIIGLASELFAQKGVEHTTVRDIADGLGIKSGALYHQFPSKEALAGEILGAHLGLLLRDYEATVSEPDPTKRLSALVRVSFRAVVDRPEPSRIFQNDYHRLGAAPGLAHLAPLVASAQRHFLDTIKAGVAVGAFRDDVEPRIFYNLLRDAIWFSARHHEPRSSSKADALYHDCLAIFLDGYATT